MRARIAAYARISEDTEGVALGVARQHQDNEKLAEMRGWEIVDRYTDNNVSAYKRDVVRPEFQRLLADLRSGSLDGLVAYDLDRIARQPSDLEDLIRIYEDRPGLVFATVQGDIDLSGNGVVMARVLVAFANKSSADTSRRVTRKMQERAEAGLSHGGKRPYGYQSDFKTLDPEEAAVVRKVGDWFMAGYSYHEITYRLNEAEYRTRRGSPWYVGTIRQMLRQPRYAAIRTYKGQEFRGVWEPIFTRDEWDMMQQLVRARQNAAKDRPVARKYLLTGLVKCGGEGCSAFLGGMTKRDRPSAPLRRTYQCATRNEFSRRKESCGGMCVGAEPLEHLIREAVCFRLDTDDLASLLSTSDESSRELAELLALNDQTSTRITALLDDYADGTLSKEDYLRARERLDERLQDIDRRINELRRARLNVTINAGQTVREAWESNPDGWRRELIETLIDEIVIHSSKLKPYYDVGGVRHRFDASRVEIKWKV